MVFSVICRKFPSNRVHISQFRSSFQGPRSGHGKGRKVSFDSRDGHEEGGFSVVAPGIYRAIADSF